MENLRIKIFEERDKAFGFMMGCVRPVVNGEIDNHPVCIERMDNPDISIKKIMLETLIQRAINRGIGIIKRNKKCK